MKVHRTALAVATAAASATQRTCAFTAPRPTWAGSPVRHLNNLSAGKKTTRNDLFISSNTSGRRGTCLQMNFIREFFKTAGLGVGGGAGGGAFGLQIDYNNLDHPGPELGELALDGVVPTSSNQDPSLSIATFAGGCFWGLELAYQRIPGIVHTAVGYTQGAEERPNYDQVCAGATGHTEAVIVYYDPDEVSYETLLEVFFQRVDPTTKNGQGRDYGKQYRTGVYFHTAEQEDIAVKRFETEKEKYTSRIATELKPAKIFWPAEKYHQQYLEKGGRFGTPQSAEKGATDEIRCYG